MHHNVAVIVGSLRAESFSGKIAAALTDRAPASLQLARVPIDTLPLYNEDREIQPPASWLAFRDTMHNASAVLFVTPEYNRSVPGGLKNAIDIGSRPASSNVLAGKPVAIVSHSVGVIGGMGAALAIRASLACLDVALLPSPEIYISSSSRHFDEAGKLSEEETASLLDRFLNAFSAWIDRHASPHRNMCEA